MIPLIKIFILCIENICMQKILTWYIILWIWNFILPTQSQYPHIFISRDATSNMRWFEIFLNMPICEFSHLLVRLIFGQLCLWPFANANVKFLSSLFRLSHAHTLEYPQPFRFMFVLNVILLWQMVPGNPLPFTLQHSHTDSHRSRESLMPPT